MYETTLNQKTVRLTLKRIEVCDLLLACTAVSASLREEGQTAKKWDDLHDKLSAILKEFDEKQGY